MALPEDYCPSCERAHPKLARELPPMDPEGVITYNPTTKSWALWSHITDSFTSRGLHSPREVAEAALGDDQFYWEWDGELGRWLTPRTRWKSVGDIVFYYNAHMRDARPIEGLSVEQVRQNLRNVMQLELADWKAGKTRPDPTAKAALIHAYEGAAVEARRRGLSSVTTTSYNIEGDRLLEVPGSTTVRFG